MELIKRHRGLVGGIAALAVVGALWAGVPASTLLLLAVVLACPLMMMTMHGGGGHGGLGGHGGHGGGERESGPHARQDSYDGNGAGP